MSASRITGWTVAVPVAASPCRVRHCISGTGSHCRVQFGCSLAEQAASWLRRPATRNDSL